MNGLPLAKKHPTAYSAVMIILTSILVMLAMFPIGYLFFIAGMSFESDFTKQLAESLTRAIGAIFVLITTYFLLDKKYDYQFNRNNIFNWLPAFIPAILMLATTLSLVFTLKSPSASGFIVPVEIIGISIFQAFCVATYEEITFRGLFCQSLLKSGKKNAITKAAF